MGGLGDVVLTAGLLSSLRDNFVDATLVLICRAGFASICDLFPKPPDQVIALDFNPYEWAIPSGELFAALEPVLEKTAGVRAELFIAGEFQPTWFTWLLAAHRKPRKAIQATLAKRPGSVLTGALDHFDLDRVEFEGPKLDANLHEIQRYAELVGFLGGTTHAAGVWAVPDAVETQVQAILRRLNLRSGEYLTCFPLGAAGIEVKRWPKENYLRAIASVRQKSPLPVLFTGDESEASDLRSFAEELGGDDVQVYAGSPESIPILAGLLLHSRAYFGNDTGPMHLASAFGVGGVAIYGGGHWPAYGPWGPGSIAMVHPLPCFGCNWDCLFGHGVCVESIRVEPVIEALGRVLAGLAEGPETVLLAELPAQANDLIRDANRRYREAELDRGDRLTSIVELRRNVDRSHGRLENLEQTATDRLRALEAQHAAIEQLRHESERRREGMDQLTALLDLRDVRIEELEEISNQRVAALESQAASYEELKREADLRSAGLHELTEHVALRDRRIGELEEVAVERFKSLQTQGRVYEELRIEAEKRTAGLLELTAQLAARDESIRQLTQIAEDRGEALEAQDAAYGELRIEAEKRTAGLIELTAHIAARDESIRQLRQIAEARSEALEAQDAVYGELRIEAEKRTAGLIELTAHIAARDSQISLWRHTADERLIALQQAGVAMRALSEEAEKRAAGLREFSEIVAARDARIDSLERAVENKQALSLAAEQAFAEQRRISDERLVALLTTDDALRAVRADSELRLRDIEELTSIVAARDALIKASEKTAAERLAALLDIGAAIQAEQKRATELLDRIQQLEKQTIGFEEELTALHGEHLYSFVIRRLKKLFFQRTPR